MGMIRWEWEETGNKKVIPAQPVVGYYGSGPPASSARGPGSTAKFLLRCFDV